MTKSNLSSGMKTAPLSERVFAAFPQYNFPAEVGSWSDNEIHVSSRGTSYGFVFKGKTTLRWCHKNYELDEGMYFAVPGNFELSSGEGYYCTQPNVTAMFSIGGPVEQLGRLKYIDGCSDTLLISPTILGDPCFNYLYIPPALNQTAHTHPSLRIGVIVSGKGYCLAENRKIDLLPGFLFVLHPDEVHSFHTASEPLRIVIFHPDSDFGPTHDNHPMLNRTLLGGVSASKIDVIRTRTIAEKVGESAIHKNIEIEGTSAQEAGST